MGIIFNKGKKKDPSIEGSFFNLKDIFLI